jgi:hypothetical protein
MLTGSTPQGLAMAAVSAPMPRRSWAPASIVVAALFTLAAVGSALRKPVTEGFDETAHLSHVAALQSMPEPFWPGFERLHLMIDPARFRFTAESNYLNHPPFYYAAMIATVPVLTPLAGAVNNDNLCHLNRPVPTIEDLLETVRDNSQVFVKHVVGIIIAATAYPADH